MWTQERFAYVNVETATPDATNLLFFMHVLCQISILQKCTRAINKSAYKYDVGDAEKIYSF